ncbi:DUF4422 domain-containing protein [Shigella boydii]
MALFIACHKQTELPNHECYIPIHAGKKISGEMLDQVLGDDTGNNISCKNKNYCELTVIYWLWKNKLFNDDYIGLVHYRRYFGNVLSNFKFKEVRIYDRANISNKMKQYDIIIPVKESLKLSVVEHYRKFHNVEDLMLAKKIVDKLYPDYSVAFRELLEQKKISLYNMFIMKAGIFDCYCDWLFSILDELEKEINLCRYDEYQSRVFGFIAERLLNVWINKNKEVFKVGEEFVINTDECSGRGAQLISQLRAKLK